MALLWLTVPHKSRHFQAGFTLIEMLIVLLIVTMILPITLKEYTLVSERQQLNAFVGRLQEMIHYAQMTAISEERYIVVEFNNSSHQVDIVLGLDTIKSVSFDKKIQFVQGTHSLTLKYSPNGTLVDSAGTLFVNTPHFSEKLVFLLGQGRFYVQTVSL